MDAGAPGAGGGSDGAGGGGDRAAPAGDGDGDGVRAMAERPDRADELAAMDVPAVVLWGDRDPAIPADAANALADGLPQGHLEVVPGAGHLAPMERPDRFIQVAEDLAARVDAAA